MKIKPLSEIVAFLQPYAAEVGVEIVDCTFDSRTRTLTVYIDMAGGLDIATCEKFHRAIDAPLDDLDPTFGQPYTLNCSSPGLDRPMKTQADFDRRMGEEVEIRFYAPYEGKKEIVGKLVGFDGTTISVETEGKVLLIPFEKTAKVCVYIDV